MTDRVLVPDEEVTELCAWHRARERDELIARIRQRWQESERVPVSSVIAMIEARAVPDSNASDGIKTRENG